MRKEEFKILYQKYLIGACTAEELQKLKQFFAQLQDTDDLEDVEILIEKDQRHIILPSDKSSDILENILTSTHPKRKTVSIYTYLRYTVAAASIFIAGFLFFKKQEQETVPSSPHVVFKNDSNHLKKVLLQDGTTVYIKPNSQITQTTNFETDTLRELHLSGEAFFAIAHNAEKAFIVQADNDVSVRVLGTRFNLKSTKEEQEVVLTQGAVALSRDKENVILKPAERAVYSKEHQAFETAVVDTLQYIAWKDNQMYFSDTKLAQVIHQLNKNYAYETQKLTVPKAAGNLEFTGYLPTNNLDKCVTILNKTFANHHIIITKK
ncbi:FecR family protein [Sphingobacterium wenxiniae]|uniref:FecR protein domain-containing protein n=1 Tax=Sphingobacterium wenxiniae TaxID=683125 RepID=A0A1I6STS0_9SPHI|nr:FecR domain-containing protein [Sphingobacterium wenxiniae]SFS80355.1 protein of unknown function [Sphingobacterium wenxiniae]